MQASHNPDEVPRHSAPSAEDLLHGASLPATTLHFSLCTPGSAEGYVNVLLDQNRLPQRIEVVESNESIRLSTIAGFTINIETPELRSVFSKLVTKECTAQTVLRLIASAQREAELLAQSQHLVPPLIIQHPDQPAVEGRKVLACGDTIEHRRSSLPASIEEWAFNHLRDEIIATRFDPSGKELASVSTSLLRYPDGSALRQVLIMDSRDDASPKQAYRYQHMSRTPADLRATNEAAFELIQDFSREPIDIFLQPYHHVRSQNPRTGERRAFLRAPAETSKVHSFEDIDSTLLETGARAGWHYVDGALKFSLSSSDSKKSSVITFLPTNQKIGVENFKRVLLHVLDEGIQSLNAAATELVSSRFNLSHDLNGDQSERILPLTTDLLSSAALGNLEQRPSREFDRSVTEILIDIARGYEWIRFSDRRFEKTRPYETNRAATAISLRVWQGGCDFIVLDEPDGERILIRPNSRHFAVGSIPEMRHFITEQLALFADNPLKLLEHHVKAGSWTSQVLGLEASSLIINQLRFLEDFLNHDTSAEMRLEDPHSLKSFARKVYNPDMPEALTYFPADPITFHAHLGESGISSFTFHLKRSWLDKIWNWNKADTVFNIPIPDWIGNTAALAHRLIADTCRELSLCFEENQGYRVREENLRAMISSMISDCSAEQPGSYRTESRSDEQQRAPEHMQARNPW